MKDLTEVLLDELLKDYQTPEQILGENGILKQLTKRLAERALQAEMTHHLGYAKHDYQSKANKETLSSSITTPMMIYLKNCHQLKKKLSSLVP